MTTYAGFTVLRNLDKWTRMYINCILIIDFKYFLNMTKTNTFFWSRAILRLFTWVSIRDFYMTTIHILYNYRCNSLRSSLSPWILDFFFILLNWLNYIFPWERSEVTVQGHTVMWHGSRSYCWHFFYLAGQSLVVTVITVCSTLIISL